MAEPKFLFGATCRCVFCGAPVQLGRFDSLSDRPGAVGMLHSEPKCERHLELMYRMSAGKSLSWGELMRLALRPFTAAESAQVRAMRVWAKRRPFSGAMIAAMQERDTTVSEWLEGHTVPVAAPPAGDGWRLEGCTADPGAPRAADVLGLGRRVFFFWVRDAPQRFECANPARPECKSIASKDGRCLGCGWSPQ